MSQLEVLIECALGQGASPFEYSIAGQTRAGWSIWLPRNNGSALDGVLRQVEQNWRRLHELNVRLLVSPGLEDQDPQMDFGRSQPPPDPDGDGFLQLLALPGLPTLDVIEFCRVGSHRAPESFNGEGVWAQLKHQLATLDPELPSRYGGDAGLQEWVAARRHGPEPWRSVRTALAGIMDLCPFAIQLADEANLHATFLDAVPTDKANQIAERILQICPEALELPPAELQRLGIPVPMDANEPEIPDYDAALLQYITKAGRFQLWWG